MRVCYKCKKITQELSPRSRCVKCEWMSNQLNEVENEQLRNALELCQEDLKWWKEIAKEHMEC